MRKKTVCHDVYVWLARTKTWLYDAVTQLDGGWDCWVVANRTINLDEFPYHQVFSLRDRYGPFRWFIETALMHTNILRHCPTIQGFVRQLMPTVIHSHFGTIGWRNLKLAKSLNAKHVVSFYGTDVTRIPRIAKWKRRYRDLFKDAKLFLCEGPHMARALEQLGCPEEKIKLYHLGVDLDRIPLQKPSWKPGQPLRILMAASFREKKGLPYAILAIAELKRRIPHLAIAVTVVGNADKSKASQLEKKKINDAINSGRITDIVTFKGSCSHSELLSLAQQYDIFLSPSVTASDGDTEGGAPVAIIEMMALGLPVVSTTHCDIPYVLIDKNKKLLVPERDVSALADSLIWLIENHTEWENITIKNRERVEAEFNIKKQGPALAEIYKGLFE